MKSKQLDLQKDQDALLGAIKAIIQAKKWSPTVLRKILNKFPKYDQSTFSKGQLNQGYYLLKKAGQISLSANEEKGLLSRIKMKQVRTISGVTPVTVFTKPYPCPGQCIYCPLDTRMPKSYLSREPGCMRALRNKFNPYLQTYNRIAALANIGHPVDKIELIILGGTWSVYPKDYQAWFIAQCFEAMNKFSPGVTDGVRSSSPGVLRSGSSGVDYKKLFQAHKKNETARVRCVGLTIETRPDEITIEEVAHLRKLGCTKV